MKLVLFSAGFGDGGSCNKGEGEIIVLKRSELFAF
jgi:hypothetical protein